MSPRYIFSGSLKDAPSFGAVVGAAGPRITSYFSNALSNACLINAFVRSAFKIVGVVVTGAQHEGAQHDTALRFRAKSFGAGLFIHIVKPVILLLCGIRI